MCARAHDDGLAACLQRAVAGREPSSGQLDAGHGTPVRSTLRSPAAPRMIARRRMLQRLIVNVGDDPLRVELKKDNGWIIASDIDAALQRGGEDQDIVELSELRGSP